MNYRILYILFFAGIMFTSCVPTKDLIYLQNKGNDNASSIVASNVKPYRLQTNDILNVSIKALDERLVEMFNNTSKAMISPTIESLFLMDTPLMIMEILEFLYLEK